MVETLFELPAVQPNRPAPRRGGIPRLESPQREQVEMRLVALDDLLPGDHRARLVWEVVQSYDLSAFYARILAVEGEAGRPAIDPRLLVAIWLYATLEGVGSAREVARLCREHLAYQWLLGGVSVNYHTLADFRVGYEAEVDALLTHSVAALLSEGLVSLEQTAQDGLRVRASAGAGSFRRRERLEAFLEQAQTHVAHLKAHSDPPPEAATPPRQPAARQRRAQERVARVKKALQELEKVEAQKAHSHNKQKKARPARASSTDPEARRMKMPDGGFRPALNGQLCIDVSSGVVVGVGVTNSVDQGQLSPMLTQLQSRYQRTPRDHFVDGGFVTHPEIETWSQAGVTLFAPLPEPRKPGSHPEHPQPGDGPGLTAWRERMSRPEGKEKYKLRAQTIEWANALARQRGLYRFLVRGLHKAKAVLLWFVLAHNVLQVARLRQVAAVQATA
jgi:transposase